MASDFWVITCYFNPCRYKTKRYNFDLFMDGMKKSGANVLVAELAFGEEEFELPAGDGVLRLRGDGLMWQKERLLNIAAATLPKSCTKIGWFDNDVLFGNPDWVRLTSEALDTHMVVQPFDWCVRLPRGTTTFDGRGETYESFAQVYSQKPGVARGGEFYQHGHTGFAWAARRELFEEIGLYDACLTCSGDHLMSHAFVGGMRHSPCIGRMIGPQQKYLKHFFTWAVKARDLVHGKVGVVPGDLLHLWHGDLVNRRYTELNNEFKTFDFDPDRDLRFDESGLWEWKDASEELRAWASEMFWLRREDGDPADEEDQEAAA
ncbi:hypothetical protein [Sphingomonas hankyongi]|uniref:Glycosyltransferase n=1 Tax=Sphingomonas hankyongi TaxID=2908209 RepID=A0ABT0RYN5_9SPHN|nr:hypothetical protein [Sphingomonas hankyongi]MCL6728717.1 hypothetical protein [Sphingomonas hankyongi]